MGYISQFDPWRSRLCSCPQKWSLNPYTGCGHGCLYCYATSFIPKFFEPRPKKNFIRVIEREITKLPKGAVISLSNSSDPYQPLEEKYQYTRKFLELIKDLDLRLLIITKSDMVLRDLDLISREKTVISITITTKRFDRLLEPMAPSFERRLKAIIELKKKGYKVVARVDPLIPFINDSESVDIVRELFPYVDHIVVSTYKARPDSLRRLQTQFPKLSSHLKRLYLEMGSYFQNSIYLPLQIRKEILLKVTSLAKRLQLSVGLCREGIYPIQKLGKCDGSFLLIS